MLDINKDKFVVIKDRDFKRFDFTGFDFRNSIFIESSFIGAIFERAEFKMTRFIKGDTQTFLSNVRELDGDIKCKDMRYTIFVNVNFDHADFSRSVFDQSIFKNCIFKYANFAWTNFSLASFGGCDFEKTCFYQANLSFSTIVNGRFRNANLSWAIFKGVAIYDENFFDEVINLEKAIGVHSICPETGSFIGYKKALRMFDFGHSEEVIIKLLIPETATRVSGFSGRKCRCNEAKVLSITNFNNTRDYDYASSSYDRGFIYIVGETVKVEDFDTNVFKSCSTGIHFFITRQEAIEY